MSAPKRFITSKHMQDAAKLVLDQQHQVIQAYPTSAGPFSNVPMATQALELPEVLEGHCLSCKGKQQFQVEGNQTMKNGTVRKYGKCTGDGCGKTISLFTQGNKDNPIPTTT